MRPPATTRRFLKTANVRVVGSFRGALDAGFVERIGDRWRSSGATAFRPVRLNFRKPGNPFERAGRTRPRPVPAARYVFSPRIQLTFPFNPVTNLFFETDTHPAFQWSLSEMNASKSWAGRPSALITPQSARWRATNITPQSIRWRATDITLQSVRWPAALTRPQTVRWRATDSTGGGFRAGLLRFGSHLKELSLVQVRSALLLPGEGQPAATPAAAGVPSRGGTFLAPPPLLVPFTIRAERGQTRARALGAGTAHPGVSKGRPEPPRGDMRIQTETRLRQTVTRLRQTEKLLSSLRSVFAPVAAAWGASSPHVSLKSAAGSGAFPPRATSRTQLVLLESGAGPASPGASPGASPAKPVLTFAALKPFDAARRERGFVPPAPLSYARREPQQSQAVVEALRGLRLSQSEAKQPAAPQWPSVEQLTGQVRQQLERELRIERERRGR